MTKKFFEAVNQAYDRMSPSEWENELAERGEMDLTPKDGLEGEAVACACRKGRDRPIGGFLYQD